jgi:diaminohydroxyphosphoribosylaminopyrimidine deaminase/5-amino-6-(5-phosphoribosylamino)uracil reductase
MGMGAVSPNPMVGAVLVCDGLIIGEGYHQKYGQAHAEVNAIQSVLTHHSDAKDLLKKSVLYVTLEPCAHFGKTPPCADLIFQHQIPKVVVGCRDPFTQVDGKGIEKLKNAGIEVIQDILSSACQNLNKRFFTRVQKQRPYIILKWAQTADGFFAPADDSQRWISSVNAKQLVHRWRSEEDAILVGKRTAAIDNPKLNVREWKGRNPKRVVIDRNLELPKHLHLFDQLEETIIFNAITTKIDGKTKYIQLEDFDTLLPQLIAYQLYLMDIQSIIIEGGAHLLKLFIQANLWDEARVFISPNYWEEGIKAPILQSKAYETIQVGIDKLELTYNNHGYK